MVSSAQRAPDRARASRSQPAATASGALLDSLLELLSFNEVLHELVKRDLKVRYKRSVIGIFWTMLNPLLMMIITTIVFSNLFRASISNFPIYMLSGYVVWGFFSQATVSASSSVIDSAGLSRKIYLPAALFPLAAVLGALINLLLAFVPLGLLVAVTGGSFSWALLFLPVSLAVLAIFTYGMGLMLAAASVFFRDTVYTYQVLLVAWMYLTPIFYPPEIIPSQWTPLVQLNPLFHLLQLVRAPVYAGALPDLGNFAIGSAYALAALVIGWWYFDRSRNQFFSYL